jgi:hypothetical protein
MAGNDHRTVASRGGPGRRRGRRGSGEPADWTKVDPAIVWRLVCAVTNNGGAVRFGYSRDGGAYAVGILGDGDPYTDWVRPSEDVEAALGEIADAWGPSAVAEDA